MLFTAGPHCASLARKLKIHGSFTRNEPLSTFSTVQAKEVDASEAFHISSQKVHDNPARDKQKGYGEKARESISILSLGEPVEIDENARTGPREIEKGTTTTLLLLCARLREASRGEEKRTRAVKWLFTVIFSYARTRERQANLVSSSPRARARIPPRIPIRCIFHKCRRRARPARYRFALSPHAYYAKISSVCHALEGKRERERERVWRGNCSAP